MTAVPGGPTSPGSGSPASVPGPRAGGAPEPVVVDASVLIDLLAGTELAAPATTRLRHTVLHAPAHLDAEVLSALGRLHRADALTVADVTAACDRLTRLPLTRHLLVDLLPEAWARRATLRLVDALYIALGARLELPVVTTDHRLARASPQAEAITS